MKKLKIITLIILFPFIVLSIINELSRLTIHEKPYAISNIHGMNSDLKIEHKCSWACHDHTAYCLEHHVKVDKQYLPEMNGLYFGLINLLKTGNQYQFVNVIFFAVLVPLFWLFLIIKLFSLQDKINAAKDSK